MSADSLRSKHVSNRVLIPGSGMALGQQPCRGQPDQRSTSGQVIRPQAVSEKTLMESVAGLINEVGLVPQPYSTNEEKENNIVWTKFESIKPNFDLNWNLRNLSEESTDETCSVDGQCHPPLVLTLAYPSGIQMWAVAASGEAQEVLSWRRPAVRLSKLLPSPATSDHLVARDIHRESRPVVAIVEGFVSPSSPNHVTFISLRTGQILKSTKFIHPVCDLVANTMAIVLSFLDKLIILDPFTFESQRTIVSSSGSATPLLNSVALGSSWLAYSDRKLLSHYQSIGGVEAAGVSSYTATVIYAAKSLTKGLKGLGESVANSITGHRNHLPTDQSGSVQEPGVVTILNLAELKSSDDEATYSSDIQHSAYVAHFVAHANHPVHAMRFDPSGLLLVTADKEGHDFHVFRIHPHPLGPNMAAVHHLYILHRGDTGAKVQDISFAHDSRWVAVSTLRGTTHIFPITPYGGAISVRTHISHRVVNRLSRFHRTAGLDDTPASGRNSPVLSFSPGGTTTTVPPVGKSYDLLHLGSPYPNPRLPPFPHPLIINPLAQLRQNFNFPSSSPKSSPPIGKSKGLLAEERVHVASSFEEPRGWILNTPGVITHCDKRKKSPVEAVYVMTCHGHLIEYYLEPKQASSTSKEKVSDDTAIELVVHARAQWNFSRPSFSKELKPPLSPTNLALLRGSTSHSAMSPLKPCSAKKTLNVGGSGMCSGAESRNAAPDIRRKGATTDDSSDERWLSQVEITTHSGPHRRLWMGPQFTFKVFNPSSMSSGNQSGVVDVETVEVNVTNRPAKSNPVNMPVSSALLPVVIEGSSGSSLEQSPRLVDPYSDSETSILPNDFNIKESLADAMMEGCAINSRDTGGCQSLGSCDDLSSSSFDSTSQHSIDVPSFCIDATLPFPD